MSTESQDHHVAPSPPAATRSSDHDRAASPTTAGAARPTPQPVRRQSSNPFASTLLYFTEPITYTVSGLVRRLSEDEAPTPLAKALSANWNGSMMDSLSSTLSAGGGGYHPPPPKRKFSPFQPPPLTPLTLKGYKDSTNRDARLLSRTLAEEIRLLIPARLQLMNSWTIAYSLEQNGSSLSSLYALCDDYKWKRGGFVLVVKDAEGGIFGAYLTDAPRPQAHYFGSGECFLWRAQKLPALPDLSTLPPPPSTDTTNLQRMTTLAVSRQASSNSLNIPSAKSTKDVNGTSNGHENGMATPERIRFKAFPYTGENDFIVFCQHEYLSAGGGDGHYGIWLNSSLNRGVSETCPTFGNEPLSDEGHKFDVLGVELWYVGS